MVAFQVIIKGFKKINQGFKKKHQQFKYRSLNSPKNFIGKNVLLRDDTILDGNCKIADNVAIDRGVHLKEHAQIRSYCRVGKISLGKYSWLDIGVIVKGLGDGQVTIGHDSYVGMYCVLDNSADIQIGNFVHISGPSTGIWTHSSAQMCFNGVPMTKLAETKYRTTAPVTIEDNVYIGGNCTIYPGIKIGHHSIIAPNSAVTKDVEPFSLMGGVPAKLIKKLS